MDNAKSIKQVIMKPEQNVNDFWLRKSKNNKQMSEVKDKNKLCHELHKTAQPPAAEPDEVSGFLSSLDFLYQNRAKQNVNPRNN